jgi:hypothetical protein
MSRMRPKWRILLILNLQPSHFSTASHEADWTQPYARRPHQLTEAEQWSLHVMQAGQKSIPNTSNLIRRVTLAAGKSSFEDVAFEDAILWLSKLSSCADPEASELGGCRSRNKRSRNKRSRHTRSRSSPWMKQSSIGLFALHANKLSRKVLAGFSTASLNSAPYHEVWSASLLSGEGQVFWV